VGEKREQGGVPMRSRCCSFFAVSGVEPEEGGRGEGKEKEGGKGGRGSVERTCKVFLHCLAAVSSWVEKGKGKEGEVRSSSFIVNMEKRRRGRGNKGDFEAGS